VTHDEFRMTIPRIQQELTNFANCKVDVWPGDREVIKSPH